MTRFAAAVVYFTLSTCVAATASAQGSGDYEGLVPSFDGDNKLGTSRPSSTRGSAFNRLIESMHPKRAVAATKSTFLKLNTGTKKIVRQTKNALTIPWKRDGKRQPASLVKNKKTGQSRSFLPSWFRQKEDKSRPPTLSEWIGRPKP